MFTEFQKTKEEKAEVKRRKLLWQATMRSKYPNFTKKGWAKDPNKFPQN